MSTVIKVDRTGITFNDGIRLYSDHSQDCCEHHELTFTDLSLDDFEGLEFDLSGDTFFKRIADFGIELIPIHGHSVRVPGHGSNNGYYGTDLDLCLQGPGWSRTYDITECQVISE